MSYPHGIITSEASPTIVSEEVGGGIHVVIGLAPVNLAVNPYGVTNKPVLAKSFKEAKELFGYSENFEKFGISEAMFAYFEVANVAPVVFINVLDPAKHKAEVNITALAVTAGQTTIDEKGILLDTLEVKSGETTLVKNTDYIASFNEDGGILISIMSEVITEIAVTATKIDPTAVKNTDVVGGYNVDTGVKTGIELIRDVFPRFGRYISIATAPGFTDATVAAALQAKTEGINGVFRCDTIIDLDSSGKTIESAVTAKETAAIVSPHAIAVWPKVRVDNRIINYSVYLAAITAAYDKENGDIPCVSISNKPLNISGVCNKNGEEIIADLTEINTLNGKGIVSAINMNGWRSWGNNTAAYPEQVSNKERWIGVRRFFTWMENRFILDYISRIDNASNYRLIEQIIEDENQYCAALVADNKCAGAYIEYKAEENPLENILAGKIVTHQHLAPYFPAEFVENIFEFDASLYENNLVTNVDGGEE